MDIPDLLPDQHVYVVPADTVFTHTRTDAATAAAHESIEVVVYAAVQRPGSPTRSSFTEDALEATLATWRTDPDYHPDVDNLVVLALDDREVRLVAGSRWDAELGLHNDALTPLIDDAFMPAAVTGDLDGALAALVAKFDEEIGHRKVLATAGAPPSFDPSRHVYLVPEGFIAVSRTEAAVAASPVPVYVVFYQQSVGLDGNTNAATARTWDAFEARGFPEDAGLVVVGADSGLWQLRVGEGVSRRLEHPGYKTHGVIQDPEEGALSALARLSEELTAADARQAARATRVRAARIGFPTLGIAGLAGVLGLRLRTARARFRKQLADWQEQVAKARGNLDEFRADTLLRDKIVELRLRGAVTLTLVQRVTGLIDEIEVGIRALESHLVACEASAGNSLLGGRWTAATKRLSEPFEFDTGRAQQRLFAGPTQIVTISPTEFMTALDGKYTEARAGWDRLLDAVNASLRKAAMDFPADDLGRMRGELASAGLPEAWVGSHPLLADADGEWARLDALRIADPVAYVDALREAIAHDDALEADVAAVVAAVSGARTARTEAEAVSLAGVSTKLTTSPRNPTTARDAAVKADDGLNHEIASEQRVDELVAMADAARGAWTKVQKCREAVLDAVVNASGRVDDAQKRVAELDQQVTAAVERLQALLSTHDSRSLSDAWDEVREAQTDAREARAALVSAQASLAEGAHLAADDAAAVVRDEHGQATRNLSELVAILDAVGKAWQDAHQVMAELDSRRLNLGSELFKYGGDVSVFSEGDTLLGVLRSSSAPDDWRARAREVAAIHSAWTSAVATARRNHEAHLIAMREAAEAAARASASSYSSSTRSSSTYRSTSSSSRSSSSSSSRSSGSSYSSSSRSSGRSFSSGGRSGGRKF